jgi:Mce-associated membrane protein
MPDRNPVPVRRALLIGGVLVIGLVALSGWLGVRAYQDRQADRSRDLMLTAARECATNLTTIDHTRAESDVQRILDCATDGFRDDFAARSESFIDVLRRSQSTSTGTVTEAGLESVDGDEGVALVAVTVRTEVAGVSDDRPRYWRMRLTLTKQGPEAKVAKVDFVR